jgi:succinate dehydrogenase / fumarate reductase, cytochrome b subunit
MGENPRNISVANLLRYKFPVMAIASIFHRISGLILFVSIPFLLWALDGSLHGGFAKIHAWLTCPVPSFCIWVVLSALIYHVLAGIKHLFMDMGHFETKCGGRVASWLVILVSVVLIVWLGVVLW